MDRVPDVHDVWLAAVERGERAQVGEPIFKRPLDLVLGICALVLTLPLWALLSLGIWLEDRGPVFFRQERLGRYGKPIHLLKFRSMIHDPASVERQASRNDPRITRVGRLLRRTALDEMPQLWNIIIGEMSFVGPRAQPEREIVRAGGEARELRMREVPGFAVRQLVRPGLTGIAQLYAPREVPHKQKFKYDLLYVKRALGLRMAEESARHRGASGRTRSAVRMFAGDLRFLWLDVRLIARSVWVAVRGEWEV